MVDFFKKKKEVILTVFDLIVIVLSYYFSVFLRFDFIVKDCQIVLQNLTVLMPIIFLLNLILFLIFRVNKGIWQYVSFRDAINIFCAVFIASFFHSS